MGGKGGKHGPRSRSKQILPTSAARKRFLKKRKARNYNRVSSRSGHLLENKWTKQFVDAKFKYVFVQIPMKGHVRTQRMSMPGQPNTGPAFRLSEKTPMGDVIFGDDLNDLKWFDSKRQYTSSFSEAQKIVYPHLNDNGGIITLKKISPYLSILLTEYRLILMECLLNQVAVMLHTMLITQRLPADRLTSDLCLINGLETFVRQHLI